MLAVSALGAGVSYANLAVALPLVVLAGGGSPTLAGGLLAANTIAFSLGALVAPRFRRAETVLAAGLATAAAGDLLLASSGGRASLAGGAIAHGMGMGLFWVGVQSALGRRAGAPGSQQAFAGQYAVYVVGTAAGGALTGAAVAVVRTLGTGHETSIRVSFLVGAAGALAALPQTLAWRRAAEPSYRTPRAGLPAPLRGLALQLPGLLLVSGMGMLLSLTPVVLRHDFRLSPLAISLVFGGLAAAKAGGSMAAGRLAGELGNRRAIAWMLTGSAVAACALVGVEEAWLFATLVAAATFLGLGAWPVCVDGALARVSPGERRELAVAWNVREYAAIAASTAVGGYVLDSHGGRALLLGLAAILLAGGAASALAVLRRPVYAPEAT